MSKTDEILRKIKGLKKGEQVKVKLRRTPKQKALLRKHGIDPGESWLIIETQEADETGGVNEQSAHQLAVEIAGTLGGKAKRNSQQLLVNEPFCPWEITLDTEQFKARLCISDSLYSFKAKHRKGERALTPEALFCVTFKSQDRVMFTKDCVGKVSKALGVPVYRQGFVEDEIVEKWLLSKPVRDHIKRIDFGPLSRLFLSPIQMEATSQLTSASACASQVRLFMGLLDALASARKPKKASESPARSKKTGKARH